MSEDSLPARYLILFGFLLLPVLVLAGVSFLFPERAPLWDDPELFRWFRYVLWFLAVVDCISPWLLEKQIGSRLSKDRMALFGYVFNVSGIIYGLLFYFAGMSRTDLYPFAAICMIGTAAWGMSRLRKAEEPF